MVEAGKSIFKLVPMDKIDRPAEGTRLEIAPEEIAELAQSIEERGLLQPILVARRDARFEIVAGERRFLAHEKLGRKKIQAKVVDADAEAVALDRATENLQRRDLSPFEEGMIYAGLRDKMGLTTAQISQKMGKSSGRVERRLDVLRMPEPFRKALHFGQVSLGVAEALWSCPDQGKRMYFLEMAIEHGITVAVARMWVDDFNKSLRRSDRDIGAGGSPGLTFDTKPIYRACDLCTGPVDYGELVELRVCPACGEAIREAVKKGSQEKGG